MAQFIPPLPADSINQPPLPADDEDGIQQLSSLSSNFDSNRLDFGEGDMQNDEQIASKRRRFNACNSHNSTFLPESNHQLGESVKIMQSESDNVLNTIASVTSMCTEAGNSSFASFDAFGDDSILDPDDNNQMIDEYSRSATSPGHDFEIIDDVESEGEEDTSRMRNDDDDSEDSVDENEIDALLDQGMHHSRSKVSGDGAVRDENTPYVEREKIVLKDRSLDPFDILPEGWVAVTHTSGIPVYLHRQSRVCTLARPYFLGPGSVRKHEIPLSAIPCLQYQKLLEREADNQNIKKNELGEFEAEKENECNANSDLNTTQENVVENGPDATCNSTTPKVKVETVNDLVRKSLNAAEVREYCAKRFEFKAITVRRYRTWRERRSHSIMQKKADRPQLPAETKLITCPLPVDKDNAEKQRRIREFWMNPSKKSDICILHEYAQHVLRTQPQYVFQELVNAKTPFSAVVTIGDVEYGRGYGHSKKVAKSEAAKNTLSILIPELSKMREDTEAQKREEVETLAFFDEVKIEDPRVSELCLKAGQPTPFAVLHECLKRNFGMGDTEIQMDMKVLKNRKNEFTMKVGKQEAKVMCRNKREGKQLASQAILKMLHPHISCWGSLLRLYCQTHEAQEKKVEEQSVLELQQKIHSSQPNKPILEKLRTEMKKLQEKRERLRQNFKGKLQVAGDSFSYSSALGSIDI